MAAEKTRIRIEHINAHVGQTRALKRAVEGSNTLMHSAQDTARRLHETPVLRSTATERPLGVSESSLLALAPDYLALLPTVPGMSEIARLRASQRRSVAPADLDAWERFHAVRKDVPGFTTELDRLRAEKEIPLLSIDHRTGQAAIGTQEGVSVGGEINLRVLHALARTPGEPVLPRSIVEQLEEGPRTVLKQRGKIGKCIGTLNNHLNNAIETVQTPHGSAYQLHATRVQYIDPEGRHWESHAYRDAIPPEEQPRDFIRLDIEPKPEPREELQELPILLRKENGRLAVDFTGFPLPEVELVGFYAGILDRLAESRGQIVSRDDLTRITDTSEVVLSRERALESRIDHINNKLGGIITPHETAEGSPGFRLDAHIINQKSVIVFLPKTEVTAQAATTEVEAAPVKPEAPFFGLLTKTDIASIAAAILEIPEGEALAVQEMFPERIPELATYIEDDVLLHLREYADLSKVKRVAYRAHDALMAAQVMVNDPEFHTNGHMLELMETDTAAAELILFLDELDQFAEKDNPDYRGIPYLADILRYPEKRRELLTFIKTPRPEGEPDKGDDNEPDQPDVPGPLRTRKKRGKMKLIEKEFPNIRDLIQDSFRNIGQTPNLPEELTINDVPRVFPTLSARKLKSFINHLGNAGYLSPKFTPGEPQTWRFSDIEIATIAVCLPHFDIETVDKNLTSATLTKRMRRQVAGIVKEEYELTGISLIAEERARLAADATGANGK